VDNGTAVDPEMLDVAEEEDEMLLRQHIFLRPCFATANAKCVQYQQSMFVA